MSKAITEMTRKNMNLIDGDVEAALQKVAEERGLTLKKERGSFNPTAGTYTIKWTFVVQTEDGIPADFAANARYFGLSADDYGREFSTYNGRFKIVGIKPRNRKYPIIAESLSDGRTYKFPESAVGRSVGA